MGPMQYLHRIVNSFLIVSEIEKLVVMLQENSYLNYVHVWNLFAAMILRIYGWSYYHIADIFAANNVYLQVNKKYMYGKYYF